MYKKTFLLPDVLDKLPRRALFAPPVISTKSSSMFVISTKRKRAEKSINKAQSLSHTPLTLRATARLYTREPVLRNRFLDAPPRLKAAAVHGEMTYLFALKCRNDIFAFQQL